MTLTLTIILAHITLSIVGALQAQAHRSGDHGSSDRRLQPAPNGAQPGRRHRKAAAQLGPASLLLIDVVTSSASTIS